MADFSGWIKALELPAKITGGVFAGCVAIYLLDRSGQLDLTLIGVWVRPTVLVAGALSGCLFVASVIGELGAIGQGLWSGRQLKKRADSDRAQAISHLDRLSEQEVYLVAKALRGGSPSFTSWAHVSGAAQLVDKGLLIQHAGTFNRDHWPFSFKDFAWEEIEKRREFFLEKEKELEAARKRKGRF